MAEAIIISGFTIIFTNLITFHVTRFKDKRREKNIVDVNIKSIITHQNVIIRALANSNGFGAAFEKAYNEELSRSENELKLIKDFKEE